jgi:hypothetical protein
VIIRMSGQVLFPDRYSNEKDRAWQPLAVIACRSTSTVSDPGGSAISSISVSRNAADVKGSAMVNVENVGLLRRGDRRKLSDARRPAP